MEFVKTYKNAIPDALCDKLIALFDNNANCIDRHDANWRRCDMMKFPHPNIQESNALYDEVALLIRSYFNKYKQDITHDGGAGTLFFCNLLEFQHMIKYTPNNEKPEHFNVHSDNWSQDSSSRQVSVIIYLNSVIEGGGTTFPYYKETIQPEKGSMLLFPSFFNYMHKGDAPISNEKYIIVSWIHVGDLPGTTKYACRKF
jgi:hypothetical protein